MGGFVLSSGSGRMTTLASGGVEVQLNYDGQCVVDRLKIAGRGIPLPTGVHSGIKVRGRWHTTERGQNPVVRITKQSVTVTGIRFGGGGVSVEEEWRFAPTKAGITWRIDRRYLSGGVVEDTASPRWAFADMSTWTGARLGTGGVAWSKLFDSLNASYGIHTDRAVFWNASHDSVLDLTAIPEKGTQMALRFSREPSGAFSMAGEATRDKLRPRDRQIRFKRQSQDIWAPFTVKAGDTTSVTYLIRAAKYSNEFGRGDLKGIDGHSVQEILNTIGRIGVLDEQVMGSNGWYSGYAVLHEPWIALMGLAVNDPNYTRNMAATLDYQRDHAIAADGMVKSRWAYTPGDEMPGTYSDDGFYECQWGRLMDTQPSYAINVAEQFDLSGDKAWVRGQKAACEAAIDYLLKRDSNGNGLVEMATSSRNDHKSGDWLDVIWASYESAFVNAQLYRALVLWGDIEDLLGDEKRAAEYRERATKLKTQFNRPLRTVDSGTRRTGGTCIGGTQMDRFTGTT